MAANNDKNIGQSINGERWIAISSDMDFDPNRVVMHKPKKIETKYGDKKEHTSVTYLSQIYYIDDDGKPCRMRVNLPKRGGCYINNFSEYIKTHGQIIGYKVSYPLSDDVDDLNPNEEYVRDAELSFRNAALKCLAEHEDDMPDTVTGKIFTLKKKKCYSDDVVLKPWFTHPNISKELKKPDTSRPKKGYFDLEHPKYVKQGGPLNIGPNLITKTAIYGPGDELYHPSKFDGKRGNCEMSIKINGASWGAEKSNHLCNIRYSVTEIVWEPSSTAATLPRVLGKNTMEKDDYNPENDPVEAPEYHDSVEAGEFESPYQEGGDPFDDIQTNNANYDSGDDSKKGLGSYEPNEEPEEETKPKKISAAERRAALLKSKKSTK